MGLLVDGVWQDQWYDTKATKGRFVRSDAQMRNWITADGSPGPSGDGGFKAAVGRYHLYVSLACPWAHRTLILRELKGLTSMIDVSVVHWYMAENGWTFEKDGAAGGDTLYQSSFMHQIYTRAHPTYSGRVTVPVLWDKEKETIVSNESSEIIRMFNTAFDHIGAHEGDYYPREHRDNIEKINAEVYDNVNNGVYKSGFATTQEAYEDAVIPLFGTLDKLELLLSEQRYLACDQVTEADWRLFATLVRFDPVYVGHFKCNLKRLVDYPNLFAYIRELYQWPGIKATVDFEHIKNHYYRSHETINPTRIVPKGPEIDWTSPHQRG